MPGKQKTLPYSQVWAWTRTPVSLQQIKNGKVFFLQWRSMSVDNYHPRRWRESESPLSSSFPEPPWSSLHLWVKNPPANTGNGGGGGFNPWVRKIPWRHKWQPTPGLPILTQKPCHRCPHGGPLLQHQTTDAQLPSRNPKFSSPLCFLSSPLSHLSGRIFVVTLDLSLPFALPV